jgi:hypothetical protein
VAVGKQYQLMSYHYYPFLRPVRARRGAETERLVDLRVIVDSEGFSSSSQVRGTLRFFEADGKSFAGGEDSRG